MLELVAYINTNGRPSRRELSERRDSDVHGVGVYWPICIIKFAGGTIRLWGCGGNGTGVRGYFRDSVQLHTESVQVHTKSVRVGFWVFSYIYIYIYISLM
jgi:hypothetical protein